MTDNNPNCVTTWAQFQQRWGGPHNFLMGGACVPMSFEFPAIDRIVDEMRQEHDAQIGTGKVGDRLLKDEYAGTFRAMPIEKAMDSGFSLAHFKLGCFDAPERFLHGFKDRVLTPWQEALAEAGYTWDRCYPIIFISGKRCATNYHMDYSHVMAWQIHGTKRFCGLNDPDRWAPAAMRLNYKPYEFAKPTVLTERDAMCFTMRPGDALWNVLLTPHWVEASDEVAMSVNISHGGLRLRGALSPNEAELVEHRKNEPGAAPNPVKGGY